MRIILFIWSVLAFQIMEGQEITQWSSYEDFGFSEDYFTQHSFNGVDYMVSHTLEDRVEFTRIKDGEIERAYITPFSLCDEDYFEWYVYQDKIIYLGPRGYQIDNINSGFSSSGTFPSVEDFQLSLIFGFQYSEGTVHFTLSQDSSFTLDMLSEAKIPDIDGEIIHREGDYVFYATGLLSDRQLLKRQINSIEADTINASFRTWRVRQEEENFYMHFKDEALMRVEKGTANLETIGIFEGTLLEIHEKGQDSLFVFTKVGSQVIQTLVVQGQSVMERPLISGDGINLSMACDDHYLYIKKRNNGLNDLWAIDYTLDEGILLLEGAENEDVFLDPKYALLIYSSQGEGGSMIFNKTSQDTHLLDLGPSDILFRLENMLWKDEEGDNYILYFDPINGFTVEEFDIENSIWKGNTLYVNDAYGLGLDYEWTGSSAYFEKFEKGQIVQIKDSEPHQVVIDVPDVYIPPIYHDGNLYFISSEEQGMDTTAYFIWGKEEEALEPSILFDPVLLAGEDDVLDYQLYGRHLVISQDGKHTAYDLDLGISYPLSDEADLIFNFARRELEHYYLVDIKVTGAPGRLILQSKEDLNDFRDIDTKSPKYILIEGDAFVYFTVDDFFYYDGTEAHLLATSEDEVSIHEVVISPDKRYISYRSTVDGERVMNVYHIETQIKKTYPLPGLTWIEMYDDNVLIFSFFGDRYEINLYDFNSDYSQVLAFDQQPIILSAFGNEFHFYDRELMEILVYDQKFILRSRHSNTDLVDFILVPVDDRKDINPLVHTAYKNRNLIQNSIVRSDAQVKVYHPETKTVSSYFDCGSNSVLVETIIAGKSTFILAGSLDQGYQMYGLNLEQYIVDVEEEVEEEKLSLYPNPSNSVIQFSTPVRSPIICDMYGRVLMQLKGETYSVNIEHLNEGVYFIQSDNFAKATKFIKVN